MRKFILFALTISLVFILGACNTNGPPTEPEEIEIGPDQLAEYYALAEQGGSYGAMIDLREYGLLDLSYYSSVTVEATLYTEYTDVDENKKVSQEDMNTAVSEEKSLGYFSLLKSGDWTDVIGRPCYNMKIEGKNVHPIQEGSGQPNYLLLESQYSDVVKYIVISSITFKVNDVVIQRVNGSDVTATGNRIVFTNSNNNPYGSAGAVIYYFKDGDLPLTPSSKVTISYTIEDYEEKPEIEHQLVISASCGIQAGEVNHDSGQCYPILEDTGVPSGSFELSGARMEGLLDAAQKKGFGLTAIRFVNNGNNVNEANNKNREVTYTLIIESITVE